MNVLALARTIEPAPARAPQRRASPALADPRQHAASVRVLACGSVDDGKSTLIGRMLWDTGGLPRDQRESLERAPRTPTGTVDFSRLVDGLAAEREQGITIDIAWRYLDTAARRLVIIDSPGHEQYTRNMATGASHADAAILLVDARAGIKRQTRRHAAILDLAGVRRVVLAVNKMDLVGWSQARFDEIAAEFEQIAHRFGFEGARAVPVSAVLGDNVARASATMPWYRGPPLIDALADAPVGDGATDGPFRMPVQLVVRAGQDFRGLAGTVSAGSIAVGEEIAEPVAGGRARVRRIVTMGRDLERAHRGQAVVLQLDTDIDVSRGAVLARPGAQPAAARSLEGRLVWLADAPFVRGRNYLVRTATDLVPAARVTIRAHLDLDTLQERPAAGCAANDIALTRIDLGRSTALDLFADQPETGSFVLIDPLSGATVAGGVMTSLDAGNDARAADGSVFRLTREALARGIGADLRTTDATAEAELRRRANEVAILMREAGVAVEIEHQWAGAARWPALLWQDAMTALSFGFVTTVLLGLV
jgi:bifunctional enzyme CysN/CysC